MVRSGAVALPGTGLGAGAVNALTAQYAAALGADDADLSGVSNTTTDYDADGRAIEQVVVNNSNGRSRGGVQSPPLP